MSSNTRVILPLPKWIASKQCCVNPKNNDNKCFKWALIYAKFYKNRTETYRYKEHWNEIKEPENVVYPVTIESVPEWEKANDMKINILRYTNNEDEPFDYYLGNEGKYHENVVTLLLIDNDEGNSHYVWVRNINSLFKSKTSGHTSFVCSQCIVKSFPTRERLDSHLQKKYCRSFGAEAVDETKLKEELINIKTKISNCRMTDKRRGMQIGDVTLEYILELLSRQNYTCSKCQELFLTTGYSPHCCNQFSIDRIDNAKPHDNDNVRLSCVFCNCKDHWAYGKLVKECDVYGCKCTEIINQITSCTPRD